MSPQVLGTLALQDVHGRRAEKSTTVPPALDTDPAAVQPAKPLGSPGVKGTASTSPCPRFAGSQNLFSSVMFSEFY